MNKEKIERILFYTLLCLITLLFLYLLKYFFYPIFWAAVIAGIFRPADSYLDKKFRNHSFSAGITISLVLLVIILPAGLIGSLLFKESVQLYDSLNSGTAGLSNSLNHFANVLAQNFYLNKLDMDKVFWIGKFAELAKGVTNYISSTLTAATQNSLAVIVKLAVMIYTLFFFLRDGDKFFDMAMRMYPLGTGRGKILFDRFILASKTTLKTTLIIGGIQGTLGGLIFFLTGIPGVMIWTVVMIFAAIIPLVGCSIVWAPMGIYMLISGHVWEGLVILAFGTVVITTVDTIMRPLMIGKGVEIHPLLIFLSTLGGLVVFGVSGFVIGPIIVSLLMTIWDMYDQFYREELSDN
ncbi:MAG: AI-2E family transporter [Deltaproteobacteria bacterium]|nr:AI-2E family transporter [Deltaproteobacteria bacterium]